MITKEYLNSKSAEEIIRGLPDTPRYCHIIDIGKSHTYCGKYARPMNSNGGAHEVAWSLSSVPIPNFCPGCGNKPCPKCVAIAKNL